MSAEPDLGPRAVTYPYRRIERPEPTPSDGPDPYGDPDPEWLRIDWRDHMGTLELAGTPVNYVELGEGEPIVFVHGLGGSWQNWLENMPHFAARGYRAIAFDLPGFGHSPMPEWNLTVPAYGRLVDELCVALDAHGSTLVGNSMGGFIAAEAAINRPDWVERLVLVSAAGISHARMRKEPVMALTRVMGAATPLALRINATALRRPRIRQLAFQSVVRHPLRLPRELLHEFFVHSVGAPGFVPAVAGLTGYDFLDRLPAIEEPTLIVWGRDDLIVPPSDAAGYRERISGAELVIFEDCGHVPMAERPVRFNRLLERFISG